MKIFSGRKSGFCYFAGIILFSSVLFWACDGLTLSIPDFVIQNTNLASAITWEVDSSSRTLDGRPGFKRTWIQFEDEQEDLNRAFTFQEEVFNTLVFYIEPGTPPNENYSKTANIEINVDLDNPQGYELSLTPVYHVDNLLDNAHSARKVTAKQLQDLSKAVVNIENARIGELYHIDLDISLKDGTRAFERFTSIPAIAFNTILDSPINPQLYVTEYGETFYPAARFTLKQDNTAHPGIYKITVTFQEQGVNTWRRATYVYESVGTGRRWQLKEVEGIDSGMSNFQVDISPLSSNPDDPVSLQVRFPMEVLETLVSEIPFPLNPDSLVPQGNTIFETYKFIIELEDEYGLVSKQGFDNGEKAPEATILKSLNLLETDLSFYSPGFVNYTLVVPNEVAQVTVEYETDPDYNQTVNFPAGQPVKLTFATENIVNFFVSSGELTQPYILKISRLFPQNYSLLSNIYAMSGTKTFGTMPVYVSVDGGESNTYVIYVGSDISELTLRAILPEIEEAADPEYFEHWKNINTNVPSIVLLNGENSELPSEPGGDYKRVNGEWTLYPETGSNLYHITVKPETGSDREYTVVVVRAAKPANLDAALSALTVSSSGTIALNPAFSSGQESYYVNVPNGTGTVTITGTVNASGAKITNIRTPGIVNSMPINQSPTNARIFSTTLSDIQAGGSYPVTITVTAPDGITHRDYHVLINGMLPKPGFTEVTDSSQTVTLKWDAVSLGSGVTGSVSYELYYNTVNNFNTAAKWGGTPAGDPVSAAVTGLENHRNYYFWVRAMNGTIPSDRDSCGPIMPKSNNTELVNIKPAGAYDLVSDGTDSYRVIIPSNTYSVSIEVTKGETHQTLTGSEGSFTVPTASTGRLTIDAPEAGGGPYTGTITVQAGDYPKTPERIYSFRIYRKLPAPVWKAPEEGVNKITLSWNPVSGPVSGAVSYDAEQSGESNDLYSAITSPFTASGLTNAAVYNFRLRARNGNSLVDSEWSESVSAMPRSNNTAVSFTVNDLSPELISGYSYTAAADAAQPRVTIILSKGEPHQTVSYSCVGGTNISSPNDTNYSFDLANGSSASVAITVYSHLGTIANYTLQIYRESVSAGVTITFYLPPDEDELIDRTDTPYYWFENDPKINISIGSVAGYTPSWYCDNQLISTYVSGWAMVNKPPRDFSVGNHTITMIARHSNGSVISKSVIIRIEAREP